MTARGPVFGTGGNQVFMEPDWETTINNSIKKHWKETQVEMTRIAIAKAPFKSGRLKGSIKGRIELAPKSRPIAIVTAEAPYAVYVEYGTRLAGRATADPPQVGELKSPYTYTTTGTHPGTVAQPFLRPALWHVLRTRFSLG